MRRGGAGAGDLSFSKGGLIPGLWVHGRLPVDVKEGTPPGRQHACLQVGVLGVPGTAGDGLARGAQRQVRSASPGFLSPKCELIIQMGCPGSGDWRPAPAHRAISPAAHVIAALVRCAVHTSSSSSSPSSRSPPARPHAASFPPPPGSSTLPASACTGSPGSAATECTPDGESRVPASRVLRAPSSASHLPAHSQLLPAAGRGRERGSGVQRGREGERERGREGGDGTIADFFFLRGWGWGLIAGRLLWLLNFKPPCTRLPVCWEP